MVKKECECMVLGKKLSLFGCFQNGITDILAVGETKINGFFPTAQCYMSGYHNP